MSEESKTIDLHGSWKNYAYKYRAGWMFPCYFCNRLTAKTKMIQNHTLWRCKHCLTRFREKEQALVEYLTKQASIKTEKDEKTKEQNISQFSQSLNVQNKTINTPLQKNEKTSNNKIETNSSFLSSVLNFLNLA